MMQQSPERRFRGLNEIEYVIYGNSPPMMNDALVVANCQHFLEGNVPNATV
jgi:hypothetical protein